MKNKKLNINISLTREGFQVFSESFIPLSKTESGFTKESERTIRFFPNLEKTQIIDRISREKGFLEFFLETYVKSKTYNYEVSEGIPRMDGNWPPVMLKAVITDGELHATDFNDYLRQILVIVKKFIPERLKKKKEVKRCQNQERN